MDNGYTITGYRQHKTVEGETFDGMALEAYDDEMLSTLIIEANPDYADVLIFEAGIALRIPIVAEVKTPDTLPPWRRNTT